MRNGITEVITCIKSGYVRMRAET